MAQVVAVLIVLGSSSGYSATQRSIGGNFTLTAHDGRQFELNSLSGRIVLIYFGFTQCPSVCPLELANIGNAMKALPDYPVSALFITIDPQRDTRERLSEYVPYFHPEIVGLTGTAQEIQSVAGQYNVAFKRVNQGTDYTMEHTSNIFILDRSGQVRAVAPFGSTVDHLIQVIRGVANEDN